MNNEGDLKEIAEWLKHIEHVAGSTYREAAARLDESSNLSLFLQHLSDDEAWHFHIMGSASEYFSSNGGKAGISLDDGLKAKIDRPFKAMNDMLQKGEISEDVLASYIVEAEFSEWNDIFLYVINSLKEKSYEFSYGAAKIQQHMNYLENQMKQFPGCMPCQDIGKGMPAVWEEKVLVVEDDPALTILLQAVLSKECSIEIAQDGKQALDLIRSTYFDAVISDIRMPNMDGIELFRMASKDSPELIDRFMYYATSPDEEQAQFIRNKGIRLILKPSSLSTIREAVRSTIRKKPFNVTL